MVVSLTQANGNPDQIAMNAVEKLTCAWINNPVTGKLECYWVKYSSNPTFFKPMSIGKTSSPEK
jgi:hypothetical protein